jgi:hypothetical protein
VADDGAREVEGGERVEGREHAAAVRGLWQSLERGVEREGEVRAAARNGAAQDRVGGRHARCRPF